MSIISLLAVFLSVLTSVLGALAPQVQQQFLNGVGTLILPPTTSSKLLQPAVQTAREGPGWFGTIALLVSAWIGSRLFIAIEHCFGVIFRVPKRAVIRKNLMAFGMLLAVPLGMSLLSSKIANQVLGNAASIRLWLTVTGMAASFLVASAFFLVISLVVPHCPVHVRGARPGVLTAGALLQLYNLAFPFYTAHFLPFENYGAAIGLTLLILLFFYYFGLILLLGAEVNAFWAGQRAPATGQAGQFDPVPIRNQRGNEVCPAAGHLHDPGQANDPGPDRAVTSEQMDADRESGH